MHNTSSEMRASSFQSPKEAAGSYPPELNTTFAQAPSILPVSQLNIFTRISTRSPPAVFFSVTIDERSYSPVTAMKQPKATFAG